VAPAGNRLARGLLAVLALLLVACGATAANEAQTTQPVAVEFTRQPLATVTATAPPSTLAPEPATSPPRTPATAVATHITEPETPLLQCTPPACREGELLTCPNADCAGGCGYICSAAATREPEFDGERAYEELLAQLAFGPRYPGSPGHRAVGDFIAATLGGLGWAVEEQPLTYRGVDGRNFIARANEGAGPVIILGAHYDSRMVADQSPGALAREPVPGAVDGASGVAVLIELARVLDLDAIPYELWLAFFDFEDQGGGGMPGWDWIVGSTYMAANLAVQPAAMVLVDMIGDADQQLYYEGYSDPALRAVLWDIAAELGYGDVFIPEVRHFMLDDHRPFLDRGIPAVDIIDFDYPYWHTVEDTADKAAPESLERVGRTLEVWLEHAP
jgi:glutaminyl-peptide cyclotransferase